MKGNQDIKLLKRKKSKRLTKTEIVNSEKCKHGMR